MREAHIGHSARRVRPARVDGPVGPRDVAGEVAEEVERHRWRPEELGPQSLVIEALVRLAYRRPGSRSLERGRREEVRARLFRVVERETVPHGPRRAGAGFGCDRLRTDRVVVGLPPLRLVVARPSTERGHRRTPRHLVLLVPAVRGLELLLGWRAIG